MAIYIKAYNVYEKLRCDFHLSPADAAKFLEDIPTEDVVPRAEVEKFIQEIDQIQKDKAEITYLKEQLIAKAKQEVAREIFEDIDNIVYQYLNNVDYSGGNMVYDLTELGMKYIGENKDE